MFSFMYNINRIDIYIIIYYHITDNLGGDESGYVWSWDWVCSIYSVVGIYTSKILRKKKEKKTRFRPRKIVRFKKKERKHAINQDKK